jgi:hypothetical protein
MLKNSAFALLLLGTTTFLDFQMKSKAASGPYEISDYVAATGIQLSGIRQAWDRHFNPPSLRKALPSDLAGWEVHPFDSDDQAIWLGRAPTEQEAQDFKSSNARKALGVTMTNGIQMIDRAYYWGDTGIHLSAIHISTTGTIGDAMKQSIMAEESSLLSGPDPFPFAEVDGVVFREVSVQDDQGSRRFIVGRLSDAVSIRLITRSRDNAAIAELLAAIDFQMLNTLLTEPLPAIIDAPPRLFDATDRVASGQSATAAGHFLATGGQARENQPGAKRSCVRKAGVLECAGG